MAGFDFEAMSEAALWQAYEQLRAVLTAKLTAQRQQLDDRLRDIENFAVSVPRGTTALQPAAAPMYRNPDRLSQIWSGRGLRPRWLVQKLTAGHALSEFQVGGDDVVRPDEPAQQRA